MLEPRYGWSRGRKGGPPSTSIRRDERGAIMLFGAFVAPFLVGAAYYFVNVGDVILRREGLQSAADTSVFAASQVSARAMNIIAAENVIMGSLAAVLIPVRAMLPAYEEVSQETGTDECTKKRVEDAKRAHQELKTISDQLEQNVGQVLRALSDSQKAIAETVPRFAENAADEAAQANDVALKNPTADLYSPSLSPQGCRLGLPVEEDSFQTACKKAKPYVSELAQKLAQDTLDTMGECKSGEKALQSAKANLEQPEGAVTCKEGQAPACTGGQTSSGTTPHPKRVAQGASNGSDHMQFWSKVEGKPIDTSRGMVELAADGNTGTAPQEAHNQGFAQAEIYFDCAGEFSSCNEEERALWQPSWLGRLRRLKTPTISFSNDSVVKNDMTSADKWNQERGALASSRKTPWGPTATGEIAQKLLNSQEGPLQ